MSTSQSCYKTQRPTAHLIKNLILPEYDDVNVNGHSIEFITFEKDNYIFNLTYKNKNKILMLKQDMFIWNRYP